MNRLAAMENGLGRLRRLRALARVGSAAALLLTTVFASLLLAFGLDYWLSMGRLERGIVLALAAGAVAWALARRLAPAVAAREDLPALALLVERREGLSSDLIAALQFADASRLQYGSRSLREAVIDCTAELSAGLDFLEGFSARRLARQAGLCALSVVLFLGSLLALPGAAPVFFNRFFLGQAHYPTRTVIAEVLAPGDRAAYGRPVVFRARVEGERPAIGRVELKAARGSLRTVLELRPETDRPEIYSARLDRALDEMYYSFFAGDAYTEPRRLRLIPLPVLQVALTVRLPEYAAGKFRLEGEGARQVTALEGSRIGVRVSSDKPLAAASLQLPEGLTPLAGRGRDFAHEPTAGSPLWAVKESLRFHVSATDEDGLAPESPPACVVQVRRDEPPRVAAASATTHVVPDARPAVRFQALDDFGLQAILVQRTVVRADGSSQKAQPIEVAVAGRRDKASGTYRVNLEELKLAKGDQVLVRFEALDYRGALPGQTGHSENLVFRVTDRAGVLQTMDELDSRMNDKLDEIIRAQLGIGD